MSIGSFVRVAVIASMFAGLDAARFMADGDAEAVVASGTLDGELLASALFHIDGFWLRVPPDTEFNRWLSQGLDRKAVVRMTAHPDRFADVKNVRILSGTLMHQTAPTPTSAAANVFGNLPPGDSPLVHVLFLKDKLTGSLGAVTFETADLVTAAKFNGYDGTYVNIVIEIETE